MATNGYGSPLRFKAQLRPGVDHPLDGIPIDVAGQLQNVVPSALVHSFDHFTKTSGPLAEGAANNGYTLVGTTGVAVATLAVDDSGKYILTTGGTENDNAVLRQTAHTINYSTSLNIIWAARIALNDVNDGEFWAGINVDNSDFVAGLPADGFFFSKAETATELSFQVRGGGTSTTVALGAPTLVDDQEYVLVIRIVNGNVTPYVYDVTAEAWTEGAVTLSTDANQPATTIDMHQHIALETGAAAALTCSIDWMYLGKDAA